MTFELLDWIIIIGFIALFLFIGTRFNSTAKKGMKGFFLGGGNLPWYLAGISMVATTFAADTPLAVTELVRKNGIAGNWMWWCFLAGGLFTTFFFSHLWKRSGVITEAEFCELRYEGKAAAGLRGFKAIYLGLFMNVIIIGWVNSAFMTLIEVFFEVDTLTAFWVTGGMMLAISAYVSISGLLGVIFTDAIQFIIAIAGCILLAYLVVHSPQIGSMDALKTAITDQAPSALNFFPTIGGDNIVNTLGLTIGSFLAFMGFQWWASWYPGAEPGGGGYIAQRMMSTKSEEDAFWATLFFQIAHYCLRPWPWIIVALATIVLYPQLTEADYKMGYVYAMRDFLPVGAKGLLFVAFIAAYMSTISTQLNWGASFLINDLVARFYLNKKSFQKSNATPETLDNDFIENQEQDDKIIVSYSRVMIFLIALVAFIVTYFIGSISDAWGFIIECGAGLGFVLIIRWYWWRINVWSEITATITPFIVYTSIYLFNKTNPSTPLEFPNSYFIIIGCTVTATIIITYLTTSKKLISDHLIRFYNQVQPQGRWSKVRSTSGVNLIENKNEQQQLSLRFAGWICSIVTTYATLFAIGYLILGMYPKFLIAFGVFLVSGTVLFFLIRKFNFGKQ